MAAGQRSDITNYFTTYIEPKALPTLENDLLLYKLGVKRPIPSNSGDTIQVQFPTNLTSSTVPVNELAGGVANQLSYTKATMQIRFYANDLQFSQLVDIINEADYRNSGFGRMQYNAAETSDLIVRDVLNGLSGIDRVNGRASAATYVTTDILNLSEINDSVTTLRVAGVRPHPMGMGGYVLVVHNRVAGDLRGDTGGGSNPNALTWYDVVRRNDVGRFEEARVGRAMGAEVMETQQITRTATGGAGGDVAYYNNFLLGDNAFMTGAIAGLPSAVESREGAGSVVHLIPPEHSQATPHGNRWILSWQFYTGAAIQDNTRARMIQSASAA